MKSSDIRKELHKYLDNADEETLHFLKEALQSYQAHKTHANVSFNPVDPRPMAIGEFIQIFKDAEQDLQNGAYYSEEEANKIMDSWKDEDL